MCNAFNSIFYEMWWIAVPDLWHAVQLLEKFVEEYYDQNPISQLGLITVHKKRAEKVSEMSGWSRVFKMSDR